MNNSNTFTHSKGQYSSNDIRNSLSGKYYSDILAKLGLLLTFIMLILSANTVKGQIYRVGDLYTAPDGSKGIVYHLFPDGSGGLVVALNDASYSCQWGGIGDIPNLENQNPLSGRLQQLLMDTAGYDHTQVMLAYQGSNTGYAASVVDFANGWFLPSPAQLRMIESQHPIIQNSISAFGGSPLSGSYWSSAEQDGDYAWQMNYYGLFLSVEKTATAKVRAVRRFAYSSMEGDSFLWSDNTTFASVTVSPASTTTYVVTGTNKYGCTATDSVTVTVNSSHITLPTVITSNITNVTATSVTCGGEVTDDGGATVMARGVCWSTSQNPTVTDNHTSDGNGTGSFNNYISGLIPNTTYYVRAYAINSEGTAYGEQVSFTTSSCFSIKIQPLFWNGAQEPLCPNYGVLTIVAVDSLTGNQIPNLSYTWFGESVFLAKNDTAWITIIPDSCNHQYEVSVTATDTTNGCSATTNYTVVVRDTLPPVFSGVLPDGHICPSFPDLNYTLPNFTAFFTNENVSDNCDPFSVLNVSQNPAAGTVIDAQTEVTITLSDLCGNESMYSIQVVLSDGLIYDTIWMPICQSELPLISSDIIVTGPDTQTVIRHEDYWGYHYCFLSTFIHSVSNSDTIAVDSVVCDDMLPLVWNGVTFMDAGTQVITLRNNLYCDSIIVMTLIVDCLDTVPVIPSGDSLSFPSAPTVTTSPVSVITANSATLNGSISNPDNVTVTAQGFEWKAAQGGTYAAVSARGATMSYNLIGLTPNTNYTYRAFVTTTHGTSYGTEVTFTTLAGQAAQDGQPCLGTPMVADHEGNIYATVQIGNQCWMRENLRTTTSPSTGTYLVSETATDGTYSGKQAFWYNNDSATYAPMKYGLLYNWNAALDTFNMEVGETSDWYYSFFVYFSDYRRGICPIGWHLPSDEEWTQLTNYVSSQSQYVCGNDNTYIAKALASSEGWCSCSGECYSGDQSATSNNATSFSAVPAGKCFGSSFYDVGCYAYFWSSTQFLSNQAFGRSIGHEYARMGRYRDDKHAGRSVRCLRDSDGTFQTQPTATTSPATAVTATSATFHGIISNPYNGIISAQGFEWKSTQSSDYTVVYVSGSPMSYNLTELTVNTSYTYRAFVITANEINYGAEVTFTTLSGQLSQDGQPCFGTPTVTDHEGNVYATVQIGDQCWMRENLRTTTSPSTGTHLVPSVGTTYYYSYTGKQARWYNNDSATSVQMKYGLLYNWNAAVDTFNTTYGEISANSYALSNNSKAVSVIFEGFRKGICPTGWHLPSDAEWTTLTKYVSSVPDYQCNGNSSHIAKALAYTEGWNNFYGDCYPGDQRVHANNATGFSAIPCGLFYGYAGKLTSFWSSTQNSSDGAYSRTIIYAGANVSRDGISKSDGCSVRCLRDCASIEDTLPPVFNGSLPDIHVCPSEIGEHYTPNYNNIDSYFANHRTLVPDITSYFTNETVSDNRYLFSSLTITQNPAAGTEIYDTTEVTVSLSDPCGNESLYSVMVIPNLIEWWFEERSVCESIQPFEWNGIAFMQSDTQTVVLQNLWGCDSIVTLFLHVLKSDTVLVDSVVCEDQLPIVWNGVAFMEAGTQTAWFTNSWGCDSGIVMTVNVMNCGPVIDDKSCPSSPTVTDHEGNVYATVQIGDQCWMRDNLRTTTSPSTGTYLIPAAGTGYTFTGKQAFWYNNDSATYAPMNYGLLYNWNAAVDTFNTAYGETSVNTSYDNAVSVTFSGKRRGICPAGWHLPSDAEWTALTNYVGSQSQYTCGGNSSYIAKALASTEGWYSNSGTCVVGNDQSSNNATGFSAVPAGICYRSSFANAGLNAHFWSSTQGSSSAYIRLLDHGYAYVGGYGNLKYYGFSVRCLRDSDGGTSQTQPTATTSPATAVTATSATLNGSVANPDNVTITAQGFEWKVSQGETYTTVSTTGTTMSYNLTGLNASTNYTYRAFVTTAQGTNYGEDVSFTTPCVSINVNFSATACNSYEWNDSVYTTSGDYIQHFETVHGCDSTVTLTLTVNYSADTAVYDTACNIYTWNDSVYTASGEYIQYFRTVHNCDSVVTLHLTVNHSDTSDFQQMSCYQFVWNGTVYDASGNYTQTLANMHGCDSVVTMHLIIYDTIFSTFEVEVCNSYLWNDSMYTHSGDYVQTFNSANGCDSIVTLHLTLWYDTTTEWSDTACEVYIWNDSVYITSGDYIQLFETVHGCDSIVTLHLTINHSANSTIYEIACNSFAWNDIIYYNSGQYEQYFQTVHGCDSTVTLHLTVHDSYDSSLFVSVLENDLPYYFNGHPCYATGVYTDTLLTVNGCDSILTLYLTVLHNVQTEIDSTICSSQLPFIWNDSVYMQSGDCTQQFSTVFGSDSTITLHLTILHSDTTDFYIISCYNFNWNGITYTETGDYSQTLSNQDGCDSLVVMHLTIYDTVFHSFTAEACDYYMWNDSIYTTSGNYTQTFMSASYCDSIVTLHLTLNYSDTVELSAVSCNSYNWNGITYTESGDYTMYMTNAVGCNLVVVMHLVINHPDTIDLYATACDSYTWNGVTYTESGNYSVYRTNMAGCDSIVTLHLTINHTVHSDLFVSDCENYIWNNMIYDESGDHVQTFTSANGCDSIVTVHLVLYSTDVMEYDATACDSLTWNDVTYSASGDYEQTFINKNGCDSVVTLHLTILNSNTTELTATACDSYEWEGTTYYESGDYSVYLTNSLGCDSIVILHLTINHSDTIDFSATACNSYNWNGVNYSESGDYMMYMTNAVGCNLVVVLHLNINYSDTIDLYVAACESYLWNGISYTESGNYSTHLVNVAGCDSIVTLHLTVNHSDEVEFYVTACDSFTWDDVVYTESGDYTNHLIDVNGCDSTVTLHLTIYQSDTTELTVTACDNFVWNGETYYVSGNYTVHLSNATGCDSTVTLHLTINYSDTVDLNATACGSYNWNGATFTESGDYVSYMTNSSGCDIVMILHLTIYQTENTEFSVVTPDSCYNWNDLTYCSSGDYVQEFQTINGCDSVVTMHLTITVGIEDHERANAMILYPNPTNNIVYVRFSMNQKPVMSNAEIQLYDMYGKFLQTVPVTGETTQIDLASFASGVYFVKAVVEGQVVAIRKVVRK